MKKTTALIVLIGGLWSLNAFAVDTVLFNGKVFTANDSEPWAQAVAIQGNRIVAVGSNSSVLALAGSNAKRIDVKGNLVIPGFNDTHAHFLVDIQAVQPPPINIPGEGPTLAETLAQVQQAVAVASPDQWILETIGNTTFYDPGATRFALDGISPHNPVILFHFVSHVAIINTRAMELTGISDTQADPFGGFYGHVNSTPLLDGRLFEYAFFDFVGRVRLLFPISHWAATYSFDTQARAKFGYTSAQEIPIGVSAEREEATLRAADLKVRVRFLCQPLSLEQSCATGFHDPNGVVTATGTKWISDGTPIERDAAYLEPYADAPSTSGIFAFHPNELEMILSRALQGAPDDSQAIIHAVGDRAVSNILDEMEKLAPAEAWRSHRLRIEHGDLWKPGDMARAAHMGVILVQNPFLVIGGIGAFWEPRLGPARAARVVPIRSALDAGIPLALGQDFFLPNPFLDLFFAVADPLNPNEAITMEQAVIAYTRTAAYAEFQEHQKGQLRSGFLADIAVLSQNIFEVPLPAVLGTNSLLTIMDGHVTWDAGAL